MLHCPDSTVFKGVGVSTARLSPPKPVACCCYPPHDEYRSQDSKAPGGWDFTAPRAVFAVAAVAILGVECVVACGPRRGRQPQSQSHHQHCKIDNFGPGQGPNFDSSFEQNLGFSDDRYTKFLVTIMRPYPTLGLRCAAAAAIVAVAGAATAGWPDTHPLAGGWASSVGNHRFTITMAAMAAMPAVGAALNTGTRSRLPN